VAELSGKGRGRDQFGLASRTSPTCSTAPITKAYAVAWLGSQANREELAKQMSLLTYVRAGLPPILTIHGDRDPYVPYSQAMRFHEALTKAGVKNQLLTIHDKGHGDFNSAENLRVWITIQDFLQSVGITPLPQ
jgi:dipeptidyl aminopeptidase/acylaminoacyl peptidase